MQTQYSHTGHCDAMLMFKLVCVLKKEIKLVKIFYFVSVLRYNPFCIIFWLLFIKKQRKKQRKKKRKIERKKER